MLFSTSQIAALAGMLSFASAAPATSALPNAIVEKRGFDCNNRVGGLNQGDCEHMSNIGVAGQGVNSFGNNGNVWIGGDGPNTFTFTNRADNPNPVGVILVLWIGQPQVNVNRPQVTYSLPNSGDSVTISLANGVSGGFSALDNHQTYLSYGVVFNTWGEFTTGNYATVDVSREPNMGGNLMDIQVSGGCRANMNECVYVCKSGNTCYLSGSYELQGCDNRYNPNAAYGYNGTDPSGGCQGWSNGGHLDVSLGQY